MGSWSIQSELFKLSGESDLQAALVSLGMARADGDADLVELAPWQRAGAETYTYIFELNDALGGRSFVLKACVVGAFGGSIEKKINEWIDRRFVLMGRGVSTPKLYGSGGGVILEEYIENNLADIIANSVHIDKIMEEIYRYAIAIVSLGFDPVAPFRDIRSRGNDMVAIDFGEDLGPPGKKINVDKVVGNLVESARRHLGLDLDGDRVRMGLWEG